MSVELAGIPSQGLGSGEILSVEVAVPRTSSAPGCVRLPCLLQSDSLQPPASFGQPKHSYGCVAWFTCDPTRVHQDLRVPDPHGATSDFTRGEDHLRGIQSPLASRLLGMHV